MQRRRLAVAELVSRHRRWWVPAAVACVALLGFVALRLVLAEVHLREVRAALGEVPAARIALAAALTAASYTLLTLHDWIALRVIGRPQPWQVGATASFLGNAISYNLGLSLLTGNSARYRIYGQAGLSLAEAVKVGAIGTLAFWNGVAATAGVALLMQRAPLHLAHWTLETVAAHAFGLVLLAAATVPLILRAGGIRRIGSSRFDLPLPEPRHLFVLVGVSVVDLLLASLVLFVLVPGLSLADYPAFFVAYVLAIVVAVFAHVPGGLGVFEAVVLAALPADKPAVFAGLLLYRLVYYLLPLLLAAVVLVLREASALRRPIGAGLTVLDRVGRALAPNAITLLVFTAGFILLVSGALPGAQARLSDLDEMLPLPFIEGSHLAGSLVGTLMLLVAPALNARLRSGFVLARVLLVAGIVFSLLKGLDYEEAALQFVILAVLQYARPAFYRRGGIATEPLDGRWLAAAAVALGLSVWAGFFAYKRVPYSDDLWWKFALHGNAPRFLRATFAAGVLMAAFAIWHLLVGRSARPAASADLPEAVARAALSRAARTDANLAFTGDKRFVISAAGDAFLMYRVRGRTWIVMGDPVGPEAAWSELVWAIRHACDAAHGRLCFYQISSEMLPLMIDMGLEVMKYGEEAHVGLADFSLEGPQAKDFRAALRRAEREGMRFAVVLPAEVPALLPELRVVSDAWLADRGGEEKRFSLGPFDADYLARFPIATVRQDGRLLAFANIWINGAGGEMSVDLMRHLPDAPAGTMDMMFVRLFQWGRDQGHETFNLGLAPLSGMPEDRLAPIWAKIGRALFERGERLYRFTGLRAFKAKFQPQWEPRYIATPGGLPRLRALVALVGAVNS
ncbi:MULTISPECIES: bifunctional lysylphosphatidylglycerol flippase/synthetase MprF [unclassified Sphingomonas]|uniref:bifunctional lysylphosphatidylglycerol flippase/synthetase MprF n=1 Tax=unclassified Sphingomonas TaxID=196159 RepID=UPI0009288F25|nr:MULTISPECIES: bifunctional lysylphosphatidylglycerol flippase/synthetase MprF [unclassified Sphingomonas]MBN8847563.1 bifunctional lysylphosphatidylglycerol flippase/synthetase MprF [Sphingomonas sp.]OJV32930.1 MAG: GNAT family N-acetyltransferase [Sphingomonas sp. 67-36]